jgi:hypothetical protein
MKESQQLNMNIDAYYILKLKTSYKYKINNRLKFIILYQYLLRQVHMYNLYIVITNRKNILHQSKKKSYKSFFINKIVHLLVIIYKSINYVLKYLI